MSCGETFAIGRSLWILGFVWIFVFESFAKADIYSFVDEDGVVHYTNIPTDGRYRKVWRDGSIKRKRVKHRHKQGAFRHALSSQYEQYIQEASQRYNIPSFLIRAVMAVESNFRPDAISSAGAKGLMQLMPETAEEMGVSNIFDPRQNILGGTRYLRVLANTFNGDLVLTLAAYNAGHLAVVRHMDIPPFAETQRYVRRVLKLYYFYKKQIQQSSEGTSKQGKSQ